MITYHSNIAGTHAVSAVKKRRGQIGQVFASPADVALRSSARHSRDFGLCQRSACCDVTQGLTHQQRGYKTGKTVHCPATCQSSPQVDAEKLYFEPNSKSQPVLRPYHGPLKVTKLPGTVGRGLVVTEDVTAGQLLAVCSPLVYTRIQPSDFADHPQLKMLSLHDQADRCLMSKLSQSMQSPQFSNALNALYDGTPESTRSIPNMSVFDYPTADDDTLLATIETLPSDAELIRVHDILGYNCLGGSHRVEKPQLMVTVDEMFLGEQESESTWRGLYPLLSVAQHSCCPNSVISFVGKTALLRATQDLLAGDQVTTSHMAPDIVPVKDRQHRLRINRDITCACPRCIVEEKLPSSIHTKIQVIHAQLGPGIMTSGLEQFSSVDDEDQRLSLPAQRVEQLLKELATDLGNTGLPMQQQHWVLFSVLGAYIYCKESLEDDIKAGDGETDAVSMRLRQLVQEMSVLYSSTEPGGARHVVDMLSQAEFTWINFPGSTWDQEAITMAEDSLQARYGFTTADQKQRALQQALEHLTNLQISNYTRSEGYI